MKMFVNFSLFLLSLLFVSCLLFKIAIAEKDTVRSEMIAKQTLAAKSD